MRDESHQVCKGCCTKEGSNGSMQCVWKEGGCELNATCSYWVHGRCSGVRGSLARVAQGFVCIVCRSGGKHVADQFCFEDVQIECVGEFVYLEDILNDAGGVEEAVAARVRAAWMKFRELGGIMCMQGLL